MLTSHHLPDLAVKVADASCLRQDLLSLLSPQLTIRGCYQRLWLPRRVNAPLVKAAHARCRYVAKRTMVKQYLPTGS